jgi:hypothetical protein
MYSCALDTYLEIAYGRNHLQIHGAMSPLNEKVRSVTSGHVGLVHVQKVFL